MIRNGLQVIAMLAIMLLPALLVIAAVNHKPAADTIHPWPRHEVTGKLVQVESLVLFGNGHKQLWIADINGAWHYTAFACEEDYQRAERLIGQLVDASGYVVTRGSEHWYVPVVLRERVAESKEVEAKP